MSCRRAFRSSRPRCLAVRRSFFASSTDHTTLLSNASAERIDGADGGKTYILFPHGTPLDLVRKVDKLQLARIHVNGNIISGAKVVQRTLGTEEEVVGRLLDMALEDVRSVGESPEALCRLEGLCKWVSDGIEGKQGSIKILGDMSLADKHSYEAVKAIATGVPREGHSVVGQKTFEAGREGWTALARDFAGTDAAGEARLYRSRGGTLAEIDHLADTSPGYLELAGGAMARFHFDSDRSGKELPF